LRQKSVIFFNYLLPLVFFFVFAYFMQAGRGAGITRVIPLVVVFGTLGSGLFGAGMRAVQEREMNILRRYKVTPISPLPLLTASTFTGWILFMPNILLILALAHFVYGMPWPPTWVSLLAFISLGLSHSAPLASFLLLSPFDAGEPNPYPVDLSPLAIPERCDVPDDHVSHVVADGHKIHPHHVFGFGCSRYVVAERQPCAKP